MVSNTKVIWPNSLPVIPDSEAGTLPQTHKHTQTFRWNTLTDIFTLITEKHRNFTCFLRLSQLPWQRHTLTWSQEHAAWGWDSRYPNCSLHCERGPLQPPILTNDRHDALTLHLVYCGLRISAQVHDDVWCTVQNWEASACMWTVKDRKRKSI